MKTPTVVLILAALIGLTFVPRARGSEFDKKTLVTFHQSMEIPGMVLPAGDYVIKRADRSLPDVVRFTNAKENHVFATVFALPTYRQVPTSDVVIITEERAANSPEAIKKWFYPGDTIGAEFVYPKSHGTLMAMNTTSTTFSEPSHTYSAPAPAVTETPAPVASETQSKAEPEQRPTETEVAQYNAPQAPAPSSAQSSQPAQTTHTETATKEDELPKTASNLPWFSFIGLLFVVGGLALRPLTRSM
jgi:LPXTG-motif cell wall-anchored protein